MKPEQHIPEVILVAKLTKRDPAALEYLYDITSDLLYGFILKVVQNEGMAEGILREVYVYVAGNMSSYKAAKGSLLAWMTGIARQRSIAALHTSVKGSTTFSLLPETERMREMMRSVDPGSRQVVDLLYFEGRTLFDAERRLALDPVTMRARVRNAVTDLRALKKNGSRNS